MKASKTEHKAPKTIALGSYVRDLLLTGLVSLVIGLIGGYFATINVHSEARQAVVSDMQVASKTVEK